MREVSPAQGRSCSMLTMTQGERDAAQVSVHGPVSHEDSA